MTRDGTFSDFVQDHEHLRVQEQHGDDGSKIDPQEDGRRVLPALGVGVVDVQREAQAV